MQQIGVKFYDEFLMKIPRLEVESIAATILSHLHKLDSGYSLVIAGGYRRGKRESGDVDVIVSHPSEEKTLFLIGELVMRLEKAQLITHTLTISSQNSKRDQQPLPWRGMHTKGSGFDTLDKALVVWQTPGAKISGQSSVASPHRRVDIIISPWKTVGCAVLGWSGGTTFQRDLRRYCKMERKLKFDSSGVRSREDGMWLDLETRVGKAPLTMEEAERRVFESLELPWRSPEERCTG